MLGWAPNGRAGEKPVLSAYGERSDSIFCGVVVGGEAKIFQIILNVQELLHDVAEGNAKQAFRRRA